MFEAATFLGKTYNVIYEDRGIVILVFWTHAKDPEQAALTAEAFFVANPRYRPRSVLTVRVEESSPHA